MCSEGLRSPQALKCSSSLQTCWNFIPPDLGVCNGGGVCSQAGDHSPPCGSNPCPSPMDPGPALPLLCKQSPAVASSAPPAHRQPGVLCGWLRSHGYAEAGSGLGSLVGLSEHPGPPRCQLSGLLLAFHLGQNEYVSLASLCVHCESKETEAHPNPLSLGM